VTVLVLTSSFPRYEDSYEVRWVLELTQWLSKRGFPSVVLAPHYSKGKFRESWGLVQVQRFPYFFPFHFEKLAYGPGLLYNIQKDFFAFIGVFPFLVSEFISTVLILVREPVKIIHTHWLIPQGYIGAVFHRIWNVPHVATVHGSDLNLITHHKILAPLGRFIIRNSDAITVNSTYMKQQLEAFMPDQREKIRVIPMGIDPDKYRLGNFSDLKKKYKTRNIILSVGRLIDWKGIVFLIDAMPRVMKEHPDSILLIAGSGPEKESLVHRVHELGLEKMILFLGVVSNEDLLSFYHSADVFVLSSINKGGKTEALGVVLLEAMASGCPVIGCNVGGIPDIITDGENGFLVPEQDPDALAEKIVRILDDNELVKKFRKNGFIRIHDVFSWEIISKKFSDAYGDILSADGEKT
jgi:glycosyltransferase involved in cell wall biosynthesis